MIKNNWITDTVQLCNDKLKDPKTKFLAEGANGLMLDKDFGTYPYVTSSNTGCAGISTGLGVPPTKLVTTLGVVKAYTTRVGEGPFPTEATGNSSFPSFILLTFLLFQVKQGNRFKKWERNLELQQEGRDAVGGLTSNR